MVMYLFGHETRVRAGNRVCKKEGIKKIMAFLKMDSERDDG
jgi:hypothetical protein